MKPKQILDKIIMEQIKKVLNEGSNTDSIDTRLSTWFKKLVPASGKAETIEGEMVRAINRIIYRYYNDGDLFFLGYGKETTLPSVMWLIRKSPIASQLKSIFNKAKQVKRYKTKYGYEIVDAHTDKDEYNNAIYEAAELVLKYVESKNGKFEPNTDHDSR